MPDWIHVWSSPELATIRILSSEGGAKVETGDCQLETKYFTQQADTASTDARETIPLYEFRKNSDGMVVLTIVNSPIDRRALDEVGNSTSRRPKDPLPKPLEVEQLSQSESEKDAKCYTHFDNTSSVSFSIELYQDGNWQNDIWLPTKGDVTVSSNYSKIHVRVCPYAKYKKAATFWTVTARRTVAGEPPPTYQFYTDRTGSLNVR
jgi:hypothetical protein